MSEVNLANSVPLRSGRFRDPSSGLGSAQSVEVDENAK